MEHVWESLFEELRGEQAAFDISQGNFTDILTAYLQKSVQGRFAVGSGHLFATDGTMTDPSDIVLYDRTCTPHLQAEGTQLIPVETAGAVIQSVDVLTEYLLQEAFAHLQTVRRLPKVTRQGFTGGIDMMATHPYTLGLIVAWESELTLEQIHQQVVRAQRDLPTTERTSAVFVIGQGLVVYETPQTSEVRFFPLEDSSPTIIRAGEDTLAFLLLYLTSYLNSIQIIPPNLMPLLKQLGQYQSR
ncbi:MAG: DUF6602 domain-containing protein [Tumebacillaceae bacterium]